MSMQLRYFYFFITFAVLVVTTGCSIKLVADYDDEVLTEIIDTSEAVNSFFLHLRETEPEQRTYANFKDEYLGIELSLRRIIFHNQARSHNDETIRQAENVLEIWIKQRKYFSPTRYQDKRNLSDGLIELNRVNVIDALLATAEGERAKADKSAD